MKSKRKLFIDKQENKIKTQSIKPISSQNKFVLKFANLEQHVLHFPGEGARNTACGWLRPSSHHICVENNYEINSV